MTMKNNKVVFEEILSGLALGSGAITGLSMTAFFISSLAQADSIKEIFNGYPPFLSASLDFITNELSATVFLIFILLTFGSGIYRLLLKNNRIQKATEDLPTLAEEIKACAARLIREADKTENAANKIESYELANAKEAIGLIDKFLDLTVSEARTADGHVRASRTAFEAIACNLRNWEDQIQAHYNQRSLFLTEVWIRSQAAYFLEEGFDVGHNVLATNGRNLCFIILAALDALIEKGDGRKVHYTAVTPVNPKDWYNWPHGHKNDKKYFENDFIGDYYRVLREIVKANERQLTHERFILCHADNEETDKIVQPFGWSLDSYFQLQNNLKGRIIPLSVPANSDFFEETDFSEFIDKLILKFKVPLNKNKAFVPLNCPEWKLIVTVPPIEKIPELTEKTCIHYFNESCYIVKSLFKLSRGLSPAAKKSVNKTIREAIFILRNLKKIQNERTNGADYKYVKEFKNRNIDIIEWLRLSHECEAYLSGNSFKGQLNAISSLRSSLLKCLDGFYQSDSDVQMLWEVFASHIHTSVDGCHIAKISKTSIEEIFEKEGEEVEAEFHLFGYEVDGGEVDWKLCITASLNYPFEVTKLSLHDGDIILGKYKAALKFLRQKQVSMPIKKFVEQGGSFA